VPMAAKAVGIDYPDLCIEILRSARLKMAKPTAKAEA
jgi:D-alanine-D-alanine ligase